MSPGAIPESVIIWASLRFRSTSSKSTPVHHNRVDVELNEKMRSMNNNTTPADDMPFNLDYMLQSLKHRQPTLRRLPFLMIPKRHWIVLDRRGAHQPSVRIS
ncbi:unnamed protein product [Aspergillus oryzae]|uniref:Unnamed protein product n=2 Tax=Aspergillus oryzae TaxID=5062 RepID=A0AAN4YDG4_ASPOZ|nr:unnamed protein product [Aspergillus oryzae]GMF87926.1 unnamed protein product [Aspergillus oryzae]GMG06424.1 unnamed protein product [Aspergillus oryzae]GMG24261.1 unnamed protein product [Aspergillus oryzae]GMG47543.1 unnamed protein product [Aspergillus oryzae var. brunneus]